MEDHMSLTLTNLQHLRVGWQKVCDQYNTTAYVAQLGGSASWACYTNRSDAEAGGTIIETLALLTKNAAARQAARVKRRQRGRATSLKVSSLKALNGAGYLLRRLLPSVPPDRSGEGGDCRREASAGDRYQGDLTDNFRVRNHPSEDTGNRRRELWDKTDPKPGGDHHLNPVLTLAAEADPDCESVLAAALVQVILIFTIDPQEIGLPSDIRDADAILLLETVTHRERDAEPLAVQRSDLEPVAESLRLGHHRDIELAVEEELREVPGRPFDERHLATRMSGVELGEKAHKAHRPDRAHHAEIDWRVIHTQELHGCRFGCLGLRHHLLEMRPNQASEVGQVRQAVLTSQQQSAELFLELVHGTRQRRL